MQKNEKKKNINAKIKNEKNTLILSSGKGNLKRSSDDFFRKYDKIFNAKKYRS